MKNASKILLSTLLSVLFLQLCLAMDTSTQQNTPNCYQEQINISELTQIKNTLNESLKSCTNTSDYYKDSYLSKNVTITNRELISLTQNIYFLEQNISDLHTEIGELKLDVSFFKISFELTLALISLTIIEFIFKLIYKKYKEA